jgi:hypothetical protein
MTRPVLIGSAAVLATLLAAPGLAVAQQPTPNQTQTEMNPDQSQGEGGTNKRKRVDQSPTDGDQQSGDVSKQRKRGNQSQMGSNDPYDDQGRMSRRYDRDRHGERRRSREGRYRYFHDGYYYATPWWSVGPGVVVGVGGRIGCREGARIASRRGFNRVRPIDCGGETYRYEGWRGGEPWRIRIDSDTGAIVSVRPAG